MNNVKFKFEDDLFRFPLEPKTDGSAGIDLQSSEEIVIPPEERRIVSTGLKIELPKSFVAEVCSRSGLSANYGIMVLNAPGIIDSDYRNEIKVILYNTSKVSFKVSKGFRVAQMLIHKLPEVTFIEDENLSKTERDLGGLGSTGL